MGAHVLISYSHGDREYVERLKGYLDQARLTVWTDTGIDYGSEWSATIATQIDACAAFVPIMSPRSRGSDWVRKEILYCRQINKPILALLPEGNASSIDVQDEPVTDGRLPSTRFVDRLHDLTLSTLHAPEPLQDAVAALRYELKGNLRHPVGFPIGRVAEPCQSARRQRPDLAGSIDAGRPPELPRDRGLPL